MSQWVDLCRALAPVGALMVLAGKGSQPTSESDLAYLAHWHNMIENEYTYVTSWSGESWILDWYGPDERAAYCHFCYSIVWRAVSRNLAEDGAPMALVEFYDERPDLVGSVIPVTDLREMIRYHTVGCGLKYWSTAAPLTEGMMERFKSGWWW